MAIDTARATPDVDTTEDTTKGARVVAPPPKLRRRPALVAASIALICLGGVLAAFAWTATSTTRAVVAVRDAVQRGQVIEAGDLMTVQVSVDPALRTVPAAQLATLIGRRAATDLAAGTLVTANQVTDQTMPSSGQSLVGVSLPPGQLPGEELVAGDRVRVVSTPGAQGEIGDAPPVTVAAEVVSVRVNDEGGQVVVTVQVPEGDAADLAARAATGNIAIVLDSRER